MSSLSKKIGKAIKNPKAAVDYLLLKSGHQVDKQGDSFEEWEARAFAAPSPHFIKQAVLLRNGMDGATWVETGTYRGSTTSVLSKVAKMVYSIEPEPTLHADAEKKFQETPNVRIIRGTSEDVFPELLPGLSGDVCFWLDGHYSGIGTHKGPLDTPIVKELDSVAENLPRMGKVVVMVDDIRLFTGEIHAYGAYPTLDYLVEWAGKNALSWHIEHDIFVARKR